MTERPAIQVTRIGDTIVALDDLAAKELAKFPQRKVLRCRISQPRSVPQHRLYWALLEKTVENFPEDPFGMVEPLEAESLHEWVKMETGYTRPVRDVHGKVTHIPRSIAFDEMDQPTFKAFFDRVKDLIETRFFPGIDSDAYEAEVRAMLADRWAA